MSDLWQFFRHVKYICISSHVVGLIIVLPMVQKLIKLHCVRRPTLFIAPHATGLAVTSRERFVAWNFVVDLLFVKIIVVFRHMT